MTPIKQAAPDVAAMQSDLAAAQEAARELDGELRVARDRIAELERQQSEPFGYFKAQPFCWTDCEEDDEGAKALYERPDPRIADLESLLNAAIMGQRELERVQGVLVGALDQISNEEIKNIGSARIVARAALAAVKPATHAPCGACADGRNLRTLARVILETKG